MRLDPALYPPKAVEQAIAAFAGSTRIHRDADSLEWVLFEDDIDQEVQNEFLNYALMSALEYHLAQR